MRKFGVLRFPAKLNQERRGHSRTALAGAMGSKAAQAYVCLRCADAATQVSGAGFDGWVMLLRDHFDTEDQAWPQEKLRLEGTAKRKLRWLEQRGVDLEACQLVATASVLLDPPEAELEDERIWCIEYFESKMYDYCRSDEELLKRVTAFQTAVLSMPSGPTGSALPLGRGSSTSASASPSTTDRSAPGCLSP